MKIKIAILGSTGSIGESTLKVIKENKFFFDVVLLTANNNYKKLIKQAKIFNAKNIIINNKSHYEKIKKSLKNSKIKVFTNHTPIKNIISGKIDITMSAIVGLAGLQPTVDAIKISKSVCLANKETIICAWDILKNLKRKYKTKILPVDSEHFSIMELIRNSHPKEIDEVIITASGGPFLKTNKKKFRFIKPSQAIKHPNWKMGKNISVDSATMMNKVFEVIEAYKLFDLDKKVYKIKIHPQSFVHSIVRFKNGLIKMILYKTDMKIPIFNILNINRNMFCRSHEINTKLLNDMNFYEVDKKRFPAIKLVDKCLNSGPSTPIIVNASNEVLVGLFLRKKIGFLDIVRNINKIFKDKDFKKYARRKAKSVKDIEIIDKWARLKTNRMCVI